MTVPATTRRAGPFNGNDSATSFPFTFKVFSKEDIQVELTDTAAVITTLVLDSDYSVSVNADQDASPGGTVTYPISGSPLALGEKLVVLGALENEQVTDLPAGGAYRAKVVEDALDRTVIQIQQIAEQIGRALTLPASAATANTTLPAPEANQLIGWNSTADALVNQDPVSLATIVAFGTARADAFVGDGTTVGFTLTSNPGALANLDVSVGGVVQRPTTDYTWSGTTLTFTSAPPLGVPVLARYMQALPQGTADSGATTYTAAGSGAISRTVQDKLRELYPSPSEYATGILTGAVDAVPALHLAFAALGAAGGSVVIPNGAVLLLDSDYTQPANCHLVGPHRIMGSPNNNVSAPYGSVGGALILNSTKTRTLRGSASVSGCLVYRKGMTFPAADSSAFAGTAFTGGGDDFGVINCAIFGFNLAITSSNCQRPRLQHNNIDCLSGVLVDSCADVSYIFGNHCWPFATIAAGGGSTTLQRSGNGFKFTTLGDWNKVFQNFTYGYARGFWVSSCNSMTLHSCSSDSTGGFAGQIGFLIDGTSTDTRLDHCQAAAQESGYYINTSAGVQTRMIGCDSWACSTHGVQVAAGDVSVIGGVQRDTGNAVTVTNNASRVFVDHVRFNNIAGSHFNATVATTKVFIGKNNDYGNAAAGVAVANTNITSPIIASASALVLPPSGDTFIVSGTTNINTISGMYPGREVTLIFQGILTVASSTATVTSVKLDNNTNLTTAANTVLTLGQNGSFVYEKARAR